MLDRNKPLFSRPVLAAIMVLSTLGIWLLNLMSSKVDLPIPELATWETSNNIPVNWIDMAGWEQGNKLIIKFVFEPEDAKGQLTNATFDLLLGDSLPISRSTINQRLSPLSAKVESYVTPLQQTLQLTLNSEPSYLIPSLEIIHTWLTQATFKPRSLINWQERHAQYINREQQLLDMLRISDGKEEDAITLDNLRSRYKELFGSTSHISVIGHLTESSQTKLKNFLDSLSTRFQSPENRRAVLVKQASSNQILGEGKLFESHSLVGVKSPISVADWATYLLWARDAVTVANNAEQIDFMQWHLSLTTQPSYVWWSQQYNPSLEKADPLPPSKWTRYSELSSYNDQEYFNTLKDQLLEQLETRARTPDWWAYISTQITHPDHSLTLNKFVSNYSEALNSFTIEDYQNKLAQLVDLGSYQDIQIK